AGGWRLQAGDWRPQGASSTALCHSEPRGKAVIMRQATRRRMLAPVHFYCRNDAMRGSFLSLAPATSHPRRRVTASAESLSLRLSTLFVALWFLGSALAHDSILATSPYYNWPKGPPPDATFFPIAVWL